MAFDGIVTKAVTDSLTDTLVPGRITKIHQPYKSDLVFTVRAGGKNHSLLISVNASFARFHLTEEKYENPKEPPMFCMLLRKHLEGGMLEKIEQDGLERIVTFYVKGRNELGDVSTKKLVLELMGRHSNIMLVDDDENLILDSIKHIPPSLSTYRTVLPGQPYKEPPHLDKINPLEADENTLIRKIQFQQGKIDKQLIGKFSGLSPLVVKEIQHRAGLVNQTTLPEAFMSVLEPVKTQNCTPQIKNGKFSVIELTHVKGEAERFDSVHAMLDRFFSGKAERDRVKQQAHDLERMLKNEHSRNKKKIKKLENTLKDSEKAGRYQRFGELLTAHMHLVRERDKSVEVTDYYDPDQQTVSIPLDPQKSPSQNAQNYFRKYTKLKNSVAVVREQIKKAEEEMRYLEDVIQQVETAAPKDLEDIREELADEGYIKKRRTGKKKKKPGVPQPEKYLSSEGIDIFVGKNNKQNEYVTNRMARQDDTWLHTKDIPGSHVVIRSQEFSDTTLHEAANLAAYFSKARSSGQVPVDYTLIRHVKKPSGSKPGYVIYDNQTTLFVTPDEEQVRDLRVK
ncbi:Rqc2 family fibronectin-binding protein [Alteribacter natronophilus]|uniref:Rqc2 family fibronectin-binding protein n=1 Tax=Alteribacter natronophilus TaxID=2583810 RepID=UPI00110EA387|nr:NFACT RNA binding domain-containing protein [Alteribacter natronophilus]TMW73159.1 fibronectin/fibrinogen-binding protein [Alteribacter natronophilus]